MVVVDVGAVVRRERARWEGGCALCVVDAGLVGLDGLGFPPNYAAASERGSSRVSMPGWVVGSTHRRSANEGEIRGGERGDDERGGVRNHLSQSAMLPRVWVYDMGASTGEGEEVCVSMCVDSVYLSLLWTSF